MDHLDRSKLSCYSCKEYFNPFTKLLKCSKGHIYCLDCSEESDNKCRCKCELKSVQNPLEKALAKENISCEFAQRGCSWKFTTEDKLVAHRNECKYQPYTCIGNKLNVWDCPWEGSKFEVEEHFKNAHKKSGNIYSHLGNTSFFFNPNHNATTKMVHLISAFNKTFVMYYEADFFTQLVSIIIYLVGRKQDANKYSYDFNILTENPHIKIKFSLPCISDTANIAKFIKQGQCVCLPYNLLKNYTKDNAFEFKFRMYKIESTRNNSE